MRRVVVSLLLTAALLACDRENSANRDVSQNTPARPGGSRETLPNRDNRPMMNPIVPPAKDEPGNRAPGAARAQPRLELNEYEIRMPSTLAAGHYSFTVVNSGKENHSLVVEGNGLHTALPQQLTRGDSAQLDLDLKAGTYTFYCPVDGHRGKGMSRTVTVQ
jgi:Copper binding proteins, plastocyanin/azurin family